MERLIPVINKLQDVFNAIGTDPLDLPQLVVVGSQSSGKSSVLEHIVGRDFLPRGSGIVTRRPLVLQLTYLAPETHDSGSVDQLEWGEFGHKPNEMFYDFGKIREEIEQETDRETGKNKGISNRPIRLKIYSPNVLNLTLVDLPGMTRVPVGEQPPDIEQQIRAMILEYISKPNAIVLAITAANTDLSNSDAIQLAREVDPHGERTIGVITKIDIMDKGTDAMEMLLGRVIPLKLGFIGVVLRSQQDIAHKKAIKEALKSEADFFHGHASYKSIASKCGTPFLAKTMNRILIQHIRNCLPELKLKVNKMLAEAQQELLSYGDPLYDTKNSQGALLLQIITRFSTNYRDAIDGKLTDLSINELYGGARVNYIFNEIFSRCLNEINPTEGLTGNDIRTAIRNATGPKAALFVPEASFELLVKSQISRLEEPSLQCIELVYDELQRIVSQLETKELVRFANLREQVVEVVNNLLNKYKNPTREMIANLINIELAFINTNHPDFVGGDGAITTILEKMARMESEKQAALANSSSQPPQQPARGQPVQPQQKPLPPQPPVGSNTGGAQNEQGFFNIFFGGNAKQPNAKEKDGKIEPATSKVSSTMKQQSSKSSISGPAERLAQVPVTIKPINKPTDRENFETELIKHLLISYFDIVRKNIKDTVPKTIIHFLVNKSKEDIQNELVASLYKENLFDHLLQESQVVAQRRDVCKIMMDSLRKAHDILNEVRDYQV